ncbi:hypothetical protein ACFRQM_21500 [Streptomyces sp. NPDC056831]|uniref:hypothetical protein n=1 Tax=Streptomyces sp. NPDC056831 TaxID=3345954 RepID=UPI0036D02A3B
MKIILGLNIDLVHFHGMVVRSQQHCAAPKGSPAMTTAMTGRQRIIGFALRIATILPAVLDTDIVSSATVPIVRGLDPAHGVDTII